MATGSGGGVGSPKERDPDRVMDDIMDGYVTPEGAKEVYGLSDEKVQEALKGPRKKVITPT
jgi:N-methylhydantoinase B/oxoprolinase/acetone carboxylase alpha subunit